MQRHGSSSSCLGGACAAAGGGATDQLSSARLARGVGHGAWGVGVGVGTMCAWRVHGVCVLCAWSAATRAAYRASTATGQGGATERAAEGGRGAAGGGGSESARRPASFHPRAHQCTQSVSSHGACDADGEHELYGIRRSLYFAKM